MSSLNLFDDVVPLEKTASNIYNDEKERYEPEREVINQWAKRISRTGDNKFTKNFKQVLSLAYGSYIFLLILKNWV